LHGKGGRKGKRGEKNDGEVQLATRTILAPGKGEGRVERRGIKGERAVEERVRKGGAPLNKNLPLHHCL